MLVLQSYRSENVPLWVTVCMESVREWAHSVGAEYHCADDAEILANLSESVRHKLTGRWPMLADIARLKLAQGALKEGHERVLWLDADVFIFDASKLHLPDVLEYGYAFGREEWIEKSGRVRSGVHNAFCLFEQGNPFLDFYVHACERIIAQHTGEHLAPQLLGPKFLKMQHNLLRFTLNDWVAMLSPDVVADLLVDGPLWRQLKELSEFGAANLCGSLLDDEVALLAVEKLTKLSTSSVCGEETSLSRGRP